MDELIKLNYEMFNFIENVTGPDDFIKEKTEFINKLCDIVKKNTTKFKIIHCRTIETKDGEELDIIIPSESEQQGGNNDFSKLTNSEENLLGIDKDNNKNNENNTPVLNRSGFTPAGEIEVDSLNEYLNNPTESDTQKGGAKPKSILKKTTLSEEIDYNPVKNSAPTPKEKLLRRLNRAPAETVKRLGKELKLKPPKNKKALSKTDVTNKILANKKYYKQANNYLKQNSWIKSDTSESSNEN